MDNFTLSDVLAAILYIASAVVLIANAWEKISKNLLKRNTQNQMLLEILIML